MVQSFRSISRKVSINRGAAPGSETSFALKFVACPVELLAPEVCASARLCYRHLGRPRSLYGFSQARDRARVLPDEHGQRRQSRAWTRTFLECAAKWKANPAHSTPQPRSMTTEVRVLRGDYIAVLPKREHHRSEWQAAMELLIWVADRVAQHVLAHRQCDDQSG